MRTGSAGSSRGINRFIDELAGVLKRAKATGTKCVRADSGFWSWELCRTLDRHRMSWSITVTNNAKVKAAIASVPETAWIDIDYTLDGYAQVAETTDIGGEPNSAERPCRSDRANGLRRCTICVPSERHLLGGPVIDGLAKVHAQVLGEQAAPGRSAWEWTLQGFREGVQRPFRCIPVERKLGAGLKGLREW